ncbi:hypothetical protein [Dermatobacter hominis]|uniref:hypothetical protein n=1 Tax=Dermatobacter hominis TaxID=2884263 RepID=UPI001D0F69AF|nr:hypothetical protein [Dermatobacter hominis]UDY37748.1 hypothetical protein LH044_09450 [Dermatobacter hominis]
MAGHGGAAVIERFRAGRDRYWFDPVPVARVDVFARIIAATVVFTVLVTDQWAVGHEGAPEAFYRPVLLARILQLGPPDPTTMLLLRIVLVAGAAWMCTRRAPRAAAATVFASYVVWLLWAFSWSKVDHDRLTIVVALLVLALTPRIGPAVERTSGWALRVVQVVFVLAYPFSAWAKLRFGGWGWMESATFARAIVRRGSTIGDWLLPYPGLLVVAQWAFIAFEVAAVILLFPRAPRLVRSAALVGVLLLHVMTYLMIGISFLPHTICITAFLPLEHLSRRWRAEHRTVGGPVDGAAQAAAIPGR